MTKLDLGVKYLKVKLGSHLKELKWAVIPNATSVIAIGPLVLEKIFLKGFYHKWASFGGDVA